MTKRPVVVTGVLLQAHGYCFVCDWTAETRNAVGLGAQHYHRTGHKVHVEVGRLVAFDAPAEKGGDAQ